MKTVSVAIYISNEAKEKFVGLAARRHQYHPILALELINKGLPSITNDDYPKMSKETQTQLANVSLEERQALKDRLPESFRVKGSFNSYLGMALTKGLELYEVEGAPPVPQEIYEIRLQCLTEKEVELLNIIYPREITIINDLAVVLKLVEKRYLQLLEIVNIHDGILINTNPINSEFKFVADKDDVITLEKDGICVSVTNSLTTIVMKTSANLSQDHLHVFCRDALTYIITAADMQD